jgi:hypothetical protein
MLVLPHPPVYEQDDEGFPRTRNSPGTEALVALGMASSEAKAWGRQHAQAVLEDAVELTRERATAVPVSYVRAVPHNWRRSTRPAPGAGASRLSSAGDGRGRAATRRTGGGGEG